VSVLLTRSLEDARELRPLLEEQGAEVLAMPAIKRVPPLDWGPADRALRSLSRFNWLAFTSRQAVQSVANRLAELGADPALTSSTRVAASGPATFAAVEKAGWRVDCFADQGGAKALADALINAGDLHGCTILLPGSDLIRPVLRDALAMAGAIVETVTVYRTIQPAPDGAALGALRSGRIGVVVLASPSAVRNLADLVDPEALRKTCLVCIGATTAAAVAERGLQTASTAQEPTAPGLLDAVLGLGEELLCRE
jgi:uroporphyrinogen-III synthase